MTKQSEYTLTAGEVAEQLHCGLSTVARWADRGELPCEQSPGGWRKFRQADIDAFRAARLAANSQDAS